MAQVEPPGLSPDSPTVNWTSSGIFLTMKIPTGININFITSCTYYHLEFAHECPTVRQSKCALYYSEIKSLVEVNESLLLNTCIRQKATRHTTGHHPAFLLLNTYN